MLAEQGVGSAHPSALQLSFNLITALLEIRNLPGDFGKVVLKGLQVRAQRRQQLRAGLYLLTATALAVSLPRRSFPDRCTPFAFEGLKLASQGHTRAHTTLCRRPRRPRQGAAQEVLEGLAVAMVQHRGFRARPDGQQRKHESHSHPLSCLRRRQCRLRWDRRDI